MEGQKTLKKIENPIQYDSLVKKAVQLLNFIFGVWKTSEISVKLRGVVQ
jgi:hypothetical protein